MINEEDEELAEEPSKEDEDNYDYDRALDEINKTMQEYQELINLINEKIALLESFLEQEQLVTKKMLFPDQGSFMKKNRNINKNLAKAYNKKKRIINNRPIPRMLRSKYI